MRFLLLSTLTNFVCAQITNQIAFVNPEPSVEGQTDRRYDLNPTYVIGSSILIQWTSTSPSNSVSMVLYQEREGDQFEYVFTNSVGITSFRWNVGTQKDLQNGNVFFFQIFVTGETAPAAGSRFFNLTRGLGDDDDDDNSISTTLSATPTISMTSQISTSTSTTGTGTASTSATSTALPNSPGSGAASSTMSTGTKVGLGVGIPVGVLVLVALAFFLWRRRKSSKVPKDDYTTTIPPATETKYTPPGDGSYAPNEMAEQGGGYYKPAGSPGAPTELSGGTATPGTMRSELASTGISANGARASEMYSPPVGTSVPHGAGGGEVHEMSGVRY